MLQATELSYLADLSPRDKLWDKRREQVGGYQSLYMGTVYHSYSERMADCSRRLVFKTGLPDNKKKRYKLRRARFCRVPQCPICQWRRALKWNAKTRQIMPKVLEDSPNARFIMLCFTVRSCQLTDLRSQLSEMNKAWAKMIRRKELKTWGWIRTTEVTRGGNDKPHPHYHALLMVPPGYFSNNYITQERWRELWGDSLKVSYLPQVNVQTVKPKKGTLKGQEIEAVIDATVEVIKYAVKPANVLRDDHNSQKPGQPVTATNVEWLIELTTQLRKTRLIATGGVLKDYFKELEDERREERQSYIYINEKLNADCESEEPEETFDWYSEVKQFATRASKAG